MNLPYDPTHPKAVENDDVEGHAIYRNEDAEALRADNGPEGMKTRATEDPAEDDTEGHFAARSESESALRADNGPEGLRSLATEDPAEDDTEGHIMARADNGPEGLRSLATEDPADDDAEGHIMARADEEALRSNDSLRVSPPPTDADSNPDGPEGLRQAF